ncbi:MAG TPA: fluoride efflux transporter CrcB [Steroidobacteraceae bacterium]|nr:fluoride efflux transporter CrcB [Steroidobacteraceae bacterium]
MTAIYLLAIAVGAVLGAWARWGLTLVLNPVFPQVPLGTLAVNLIGGLLVGIAITVAEPAGLALATRLFITTGFLGAFTTFSAFSAETMALILRADYGWALATAAAHLLGSLLMTGAGIFMVRMILAR